MTRLKALWPLWAVLAAGLAIPVFRLHFFHTESAPIGLWRAVPAAEPRVGDVARFCMGPEEARLTAGRPYAGGRRGGPCPHDTWMLAKPVVAVAGDTVVHTPDAVRVNGRALPLSGTRTRDSRGLPVPVAGYGTIVLGEGELWMHSPYADGSFDSRYLGVVRRSQMHGTVRPVLTWLTRSQRAALRARGLRGRRCGLVACVQRISVRVVVECAGSYIYTLPVSGPPAARSSRAGPCGCHRADQRRDQRPAPGLPSCAEQGPDCLTLAHCRVALGHPLQRSTGAGPPCGCTCMKKLGSVEHDRVRDAYIGDVLCPQESSAGRFCTDGRAVAGIPTA